MAKVNEYKKILTPISPKLIRWVCSCGGVLRYTETNIRCHPPIYCHQCDKCENKGEFPSISGSIEWVEDG